MIADLSDNATWDDVLYEIYMRKKFADAEADEAAGNIL
jgi:hypothetical protein